ncbi:YhcH/YjgK/YiaL family protein [Photobacterium indicum]|uniref:YhcH/YjgK/YiaL family protein n=1 Tax=Photobacterium indicum TaxID=81447 RepID=A0A2T3LEX4_9GAMM|nr:YhcH/YjgK/YiaL family protein [Photobacterium indicum]PSV49934.1 hypothetical protein C9J47_05125 [Photobacterium indicum]
MILTTIPTITANTRPSALERIILDVMSRDPMQFATGINAIDGENVFVNRISGTTKQVDDALSEIHSRYIDVHIVLAGHEQYAAPLATVDVDNIPYFNIDNDAALQADIANEQVFTLMEHQCVTFFPGEWHRPMLCVETPSSIEKIVIKVKADWL